MRGWELVLAAVFYLIFKLGFIALLLVGGIWLVVWALRATQVL